MWKTEYRFGWAWIFLTFSFAIHVADEALNDFLQVYNPAILAIKENISFFPAPTFSFGIWFTGLIVVILILFAVSSYAFKNNRWLKKFSYFYGVVMLLNGFGHILGSFVLGYFMPGVYSAPLLIISSIYLLLSIGKLKEKS